MARDWQDVAGTNAAAWSIPPAALQNLDTLTQAADTALAAAKNETTRTPVATAQCKEAFDALIALILPMNPPRVELDNAVRFVFAEHGVTIKKSRFLDRKPPREKRAIPPESRHDEEVPGPGKNRRRKRRRKKAGPDAGPGEGK
jgi:hypothetical protein